MKIVRVCSDSDMLEELLLRIDADESYHPFESRFQALAFILINSPRPLVCSYYKCWKNIQNVCFSALG